ncbi:MAG: cellulase family glycosylhydrolase [Oscillospiraceae bacterium]|nr:cellulase family glycosylhydrolase [Oscillospiraceae bacterium]
MRKFGKARFAGLCAAAGMLLSQLSVLPAQAAGEISDKDIKKECDAVITYDGGKELKRGENIEVSAGDFGTDASAVISEVWLDISCDTSKNLPTMPAFGYSAPGCGEYDWYSDGLWIQQPTANATVVLKASEEYTIPGKFQLQLWGEEGESLDSITLNAVGIVTGKRDNLGIMTRKGDVNDDKTVNVADAVALCKYLTEGEYVKVPANADLDKDNKLTALDLTLLKRGLINGEFNKTVGDQTAMEFVSNIKLGWNLGNTLDSTVNSYSSPNAAETAWGCPTTTKAMIDTVKQAGFNLVRLPVTWGEKVDPTTYKIDDAWMKRVQEIVDYVIDNDMYCIVNIHHDNSKRSCPYFYPDQENYDKSIKFITSVWTQVATRFESYSDHLIFETLNEPRLVGTSDEWNGGNAEARKIVNEYNAEALKAIRATGGNNEKRFVMMPTYAANCDVATTDMVLPNDDHLIVDLHGYSPYEFALKTDGTNEWDQGSGSGPIVQILSNAKSKFIDKGIPVIIGEFGAMNKSNEDTRAAWAKYYVGTAKQYGIPCVWWDNNYFEDSRSGNGESFGLINRNTCKVEYPKIMDAMNEALAN